jgi:predicted phage terminase large subunit-like protein
MEATATDRTKTLLDEFWRTSPARMAEYLENGRYQRYKHICLLDSKMRDAIALGNARIVISMPPRHGKSFLSSLYTPAWFLSLWPERNVILTSYEANFAASWGRKVRNFIQEHGPTLNVKLADDSLASDRWQTLEGGGMITAGIGGPITGRGGHLIIVDDPVKNWEEALSETQRQKAIDWFNSTLYTRAEPGASIIVLMTRWHQRDLAGYLLTEHEDSWLELRLPAIAEEGDPLGRDLGQALCPERYNHEALERFRMAVGSRVWNSLYQQRPSTDEGNIFKRQWWKYYREMPNRFETKIMSCDLAFKETKTSDYVVLQIWGRVGAEKFLIDQVRARMDFPTTVQAIRSLRSKHLPSVILIEDKANGPAVIDTLKKEISGVIAVKPDGGKEARASSISAQIEAGNVYLPELTTNPWVNDFIEECANFPNGANDDCVDAMTYALKRLENRQVNFAPIAGHGSGMIFNNYS